MQLPSLSVARCPESPFVAASPCVAFCSRFECSSGGRGFPIKQTDRQVAAGRPACRLAKVPAGFRASVPAAHRLGFGPAGRRAGRQPFWRARRCGRYSFHPWSPFGFSAGSAIRVRKARSHPLAFHGSTFLYQAGGSLPPWGRKLGARGWCPRSSARAPWAPGLEPEVISVPNFVSLSRK